MVLFFSVARTNADGEVEEQKLLLLTVLFLDTGRTWYKADVADNVFKVARRARM